MTDYKDKAITIIQTLCNATGAEFENEALAVDIIASNLLLESQGFAKEIQRLKKLIKPEGIYYPSVQDMKSSITCNWKNTTIENLEADLLVEQKGNKRSSVISYLQACIKRKRKEAKND